VDTTATFTAEGTYVLRLSADDGELSSNDEVTVTVNPEPINTLHVGDLDAVKSVKGKSGWWKVFVTVTVHDQDHMPVPITVVSGVWSGAASGTVSGTTLDNGTVEFNTQKIRGGTRITFSVTSLTNGSHTYDDNENHDPDPDPDSDGTNITVIK
jgi:hypothetical protein